MICRKIYYAHAGVLMLGCVLTSSAIATSTDVILDLDGNPGCSQLVENSAIDETRDTAPGGTKTLSVTGAPYQCITYTASSAGVSSWGTNYCANSNYGADPETDPPIYPVNMVVIKAQGSAGARVWHYGAEGEVGDTLLESPGDVRSVAFCTGLNDVIVAPPEVKRCDAIADVPGEVNLVEAACDLLPATDRATVHVVRKGEDGRETLESCTCNETAIECDPRLPPGVYKSCIQTPDGETSVAEDLLLRQVPGIIKHINNGSFYCSDFSGTLECANFGAFGF